MGVATAERSLADGHEALARGDWASAREAFAQAVAVAEAPEALDGLGRAQWWLRDAEGAVVSRERAYAGFRREGELARAARIALWLAREYALVWANDAAASGWLARAERLLADVAPGAEQGWLDLARSERERDPGAAAALAAAAVDTAVAAQDPDLELRALAQLGLAEVSSGRVDEGLARLDEAMAAATSGEPTTLETFADVCCTLMLACERAGDADRPRQWTEVFERFVRAYDHLPLLAFCRSCCADVYAASGRVDAAEAELLAALQELAAAGQRSRCASPAARLAELRVLQGRFAEAEQLLAGFEGSPEALHAAVSLRLARGEAEAAAVLLTARIAEVGRTSLLAAPLLGRLVEARLAAGQLEAAANAASDLELIAGEAGRERVEAIATLARGRVAAATGGPDAPELLRDAVNRFAAIRLPLDGARARLDLARALADDPSSREVAVDVARRAHGELEALGALHDADEAAALLRALGAKAAAGPRSAGALSRRELQVLRLVGEGLTNREIAERLFISPKTAEHHVGRILAKLELRSRAEAAAYAERHLVPE